MLLQNTKVWFNKQSTTLKIHNLILANHGIYSCIWTEKEQLYYDEVPLIVEGKLPGAHLGVLKGVLLILRREQNNRSACE